MSESFHVPVLADELLELIPDARRVVDCTLGDGGHAELYLARGASVLGIDRDPGAIDRAARRLEAANAGRLELVEGNAYDPAVRDRIAGFRPDLILLDLGVSSRQLDDDQLGFSFRPGAILDMRMARAGPTAADLLNEVAEEDLAIWFRELADEPRARRLAAEIGRRRSNRHFSTSDDLVNAIRAALGPKSGPADFARIFQALRIAVNDELAGLEASLPAFRDALVPGGALAAVSYHSGEDRIVKHAFREWSRACVCPPELVVCRCRGRPLGRELVRRPVRPGPAEIARNPRARSARLRIFRVAGDGGEAR
jgi:16S rRNA (cytosine1402-N4)-methyltransferase